MTKTYRIAGPTDEIAVESLADELSLIDGAHDADIDAEAGRITVHGENFADEDVRAAAANAGFEIQE